MLLYCIPVALAHGPSEVVSTLDESERYDLPEPLNPHHGSAVKVGLGKPNIIGDYDPQPLIQGLAELSLPMRACFQQGRQDEHNIAPEGDITLAFTLQADTTSSMRITRSNLGHRQVEECIGRILSGLRPPAPVSGDVVVTLHADFSDWQQGEPHTNVETPTPRPARDFLMESPLDP